MSQELQTIILWTVNGCFIGYSIAGWLAYFRLGKTERMAEKALKASQDMLRKEGE